MPNFLLEEPFRKHLSNDAIVLYMYLYDLAYLSYENSRNKKGDERPYWVNKYGELFVHCTLKTICEKLNCGHDKAAKVLRELEDVRLIIKRSRGNGHAAQIVLLDPDFRIGKSDAVASEKPKLEVRESRNSRSGKADTNNTDKINTNIISVNHPPQKSYGREEVEQEIIENIAFDVLWADFPEYRDTLTGILEVIVDTICSGKETMSINGADHDIEEVRKRFYALDDMDIRYLIDKIRDMDSPIKSFHGFCRTLLFESKYASNRYYDSKINSDIAAGKLQL